MNFINSGCDYVVPVLYVCQYDSSCGNIPPISLVKAIFMHAKERFITFSMHICIFVEQSKQNNFAKLKIKGVYI